jgi:hypothetical protein
VILPVGKQIRRLYRDAGWCFGIFSLPTRGTYVEFSNRYPSRRGSVTPSQSLSTGRPPAFNRAFIDCGFPQEADIPTNLEPGDPLSSKVFTPLGFTPLLMPELVNCWGFRFAYDGMAEIIARTLTATSPRYSTIKELDRKVRELQLPPQALEAMCGGPGVDLRSIPLPACMLAHTVANLQNVSELISLFCCKRHLMLSDALECSSPFIVISLSRPSSKTPKTQ